MTCAAMRGTIAILCMLQLEGIGLSCHRICQGLMLYAVILLNLLCYKNDKGKQSL